MRTWQITVRHGHRHHTFTVDAEGLPAALAAAAEGIPERIAAEADLAEIRIAVDPDERRFVGEDESRP